MALTYGFALTATDNSAGFSNALNAIIGDGITLRGSGFSLTINGLTATLASGYALVAGRWLESDEPTTMHIDAAWNNRDRVDALAVRVDYEARKASLEVLADVDPVKIRQDPSVLRDSAQYCILLYLIKVRRGATSLAPDDITDLRNDVDLCGHVTTLSDITGDVIYIYNFLNGGIDTEVARLIGLSNQVIAKADAAILELDKAIRQAGGSAEVGELMASRRPPSEPGWLLCDGGAVPVGYAALSALLDGTLPDISKATDRYKTYIFGGTPVLVSSN